MLVGSESDNATTERIIGCAMEVHRVLGPGLLESVYEEALCRELQISQLAFARQVGVPLYYNGALISKHRPDLIVATRVVVEVKSVSRLEPVYVAQLITHLQVLDLHVGLLLNFNTVVMRHGIRRVIR
jgi:GxxExxY protein